MNKIVYFLLIFNSVVFGQVQQLDTTPLQLDTILSSESGDSLVLRGTALYVASKDSIKDPVDYGAIDRVNFDYAKKIIHLYGDAYLRYQTMEIKADYIKIDMNTNIATAIPKIDSSGKKIGVPRFKDGEQNFDAQKLDYNFKTKKGIISEIVSKEQDIYIHGKVTKFISKDNPETHGDDVIYSKDAIFTTCNHPDPHFGIFSRKQKVIPNKLVIVGPSKVVIKGIPTPLQLPFGFFPISKDRQGGLIFPKNYTYQD
ncbi:MAG TPA: putative LPS assembly protein LptD, partial [Saprospiraceae bacterium]|nr:putative LPS assembly protein LptD [Saprospiraceae bacterium]